MTIVQRVARISGWGFVVMAIWGGMVVGTSMISDPAFAPRLWGLFPVNFPHNLVHLGFGLWGLNAAGSFGRARVYASVAGAAYLLLAGLGLVAPSMFGLMPIGGNDVWLHALLAIVLLGAAGTTSGQPDGTEAAPPPGRKGDAQGRAP